MENSSEASDSLTSEQDSQTPNPQQGEIVEHDKEIGYFRSEQHFVSLTNYTIECVGYVTRGREDEAEGFLFIVKQKSTTSYGKKKAYYITWRDMSCQSEILKRMNSKKLWTSPNGMRYKQEFLPQYMKAMCDRYLANTPKRVHPVELYGLQPGSNPPLWVLGSKSHIRVEEGTAVLINSSDSNYCVLDSQLNLPNNDFEDLDTGDGLRNLLTILKEIYKGMNYTSALLIFGGVALSTHFSSLGDKLEFSPVVAAGSPITAKSTAVKAALSVFGNIQAYEGTAAGLLKKLENRTIPIWWEDADDFKVIEKVVVSVFNKVERTTYHGEKVTKALPVITFNPESVFSHSSSKKLLRTISRLTIVPFTEIADPLDISSRLSFQSQFAEAIGESMRSVGLILGLHQDLEAVILNPKSSNVLERVQDIVEGVQCRDILDLRSKMSYALLFYSTAKILERLGMLEESFYDELSDWCAGTLLPQYKAIGKSGVDKESARLNAPNNAIKEVILGILEKAANNYEEAKKFLVPKSKPKGCLCGEVAAFNITKAVKIHPAAGGQEAAIRFYIKSSNIGCIGRKMRFPDGQLTCCHIKRSSLPGNILRKLDEVFKENQANDELQKVLKEGEMADPENEEKDELQVVMTEGERTEGEKNGKDELQVVMIDGERAEDGQRNCQMKRKRGAEHLRDGLSDCYLPARRRRNEKKNR